jgi:hypothetical protein
MNLATLFPQIWPSGAAKPPSSRVAYSIAYDCESKIGSKILFWGKKITFLKDISHPSGGFAGVFK